VEKTKFSDCKFSEIFYFYCFVITLRFFFWSWLKDCFISSYLYSKHLSSTLCVLEM
jgi:hypothetical protein